MKTFLVTLRFTVRAKTGVAAREMVMSSLNRNGLLKVTLLDIKDADSLQPELFETLDGEVTGARNTDPWTSHDALRKLNVASVQWKVLITHASHPAGLTDDELLIIMGSTLLKDFTHRKRRSELQKKYKFLEDTGETRITRNGKSAVVWRISEAGMEFIRKHQPQS